MVAFYFMLLLCCPAFSLQNFYDTELAERLWDALVLRPVHPSDVGQGLNLMRQGAAYNSFFSLDTMVGTRGADCMFLLALPSNVSCSRPVCFASAGRHDHADSHVVPCNICLWLSGALHAGRDPAAGFLCAIAYHMPLQLQSAHVLDPCPATDNLLRSVCLQAAMHHTPTSVFCVAAERTPCPPDHGAPRGLPGSGGVGGVPGLLHQGVFAWEVHQDFLIW